MINSMNEIIYRCRRGLLILVIILQPTIAIAGQHEGIKTQLDPIFADWNSLDTPGMSVAVIREGQLIYSNGFGSAQLEYDIPITPATIFHVASVSKQFTTMAVLLLEARGLLSFDDEVQKHLSWVPTFDHPVTIRQLANHTSGIRDQWELLVMAGWRFDDVITMDDIRRLMKLQRELNFVPQSEMLYSNMGYTLLAEVVAEVSGETFEQFTRENIFEPLGMVHTHFHTDHEEIDKGRSYSYRLAKGDELKKSVLSYANAGATSLFTTAEDLALWLDNFRTQKVGGPAVMKQIMEVPVLTEGEPSEMRGEGYAGGLALGEYRGVKTIGHGGADAGFRSSVTWYPEHDLGIAVLSNAAHGDPGSHLQKVADVLLADVLAPIPPSEQPSTGTDPIVVDPGVLQGYAGSYNVEIGAVITFTVENDVLQAEVGGIGEFTPIPVSETRFLVSMLNAELTFEPGPGGHAESLILTMGEQAFAGERLQALTLSDEDAARYTGSYYSPEIRTRIDVANGEGGLFIQHERHGDIHLSSAVTVEPGEFPSELKGDQWFCNKVVFESDDAGVISGLRISGGRVRNLLFEKHSFD